MEHRATALRNRTERAHVRDEVFTAGGRTFRWIEETPPTGALPGLTDPHAFTRSIVPEREKRGARGVVHPAATGSVRVEARWVSWRVPGERVNAWGFYLRRDGATAANDTFVLAAWGEGDTLAWADPRERERDALRTALRAPPPWFARGMRSADPGFRARLDVVGATNGALRTPQAIAILPASARAADDRRDVLLSMVRAWRATHPARR